MNICMFTNTYLPHVGGVARSVTIFASDLKKEGHRILVVAPTYRNRLQDEEIERNVLRVPAIQNFNGSDFSVRIPLPFIIDDAISRFKPHVIHSHHPFLLGDAALRVARQRDLPLVFTHHTLYEKYTHYVPLNSPAMERFAIHLSSEYANLCTEIVAPSQSVAALLAKRGVKRPIRIIPTGVDIAFFRNGDGKRFRESQGIPEKAWVIGHLGRLAPEKNLEYLAEAVGLFMAGHPEAWFLVAGAGPSEAAIREILKAQRVEDRLLMAGKVSGSDLCDAYHAMDLFAFASRTETQGMVLAEAMAAGRPVVALDASGVREVVTDQENGRLLPADTTAAAFAGALEQAFENPGQVSAWRAAALKTARQFERRRLARQLAGLYEHVLAAGTPADEEISHYSFSWDSLLKLLKAEWNLIAGKTQAVMNAMDDEDGASRAGLE